MMQIIIAWIACGFLLIISALTATASVQLLQEKNNGMPALVGFAIVLVCLALAYGAAWVGGI